MTFKAPENLTEQIARHLGEQIITNRLAPGERIQEMRIASELNVSRGSVREALLILARRHLVTIYPRRGAVVSSQTPEDVKALYEMAGLLFASVARKAAVEHSKDQLEPFYQHLEAMVQAIQSQNIQAMYEETFNFATRAYMTFADNRFLSEALDNLDSVMRRSYYMAMHLHIEEMQTSVTFFTNLIQRVVERDGEGASQEITRFFDHQCKMVLGHLQG